ncbi:MAG: alpha/beta hydrolase family protein [Candidatus Limnocylindria bacterium]
MQHRSEAVTFRAGESTLAGTLVLPDANDRLPWVLLLPSWLARDRDGAWDRARHPGWFGERGGRDPGGLLGRLAAALAERGVASFRWDKREWAATDLFTLIDDARDAIGALRSRPELDLRRTGAIGHGEGAGIALSVAIGDPAIGALTLIGASARSFRDVLRRGVAERERRGTDRDHALIAALDRNAEELIERADRREPAAELRVGSDAITLNLAALQQAFRTPPLALATMLHRSVMLVHGTDDAWADPAEGRLLQVTLRTAGDQPRLDVIAGAGHDLAEADDARIGEIAADLAARLVPRELPPVLLAIEDMNR